MRMREGELMDIEDRAEKWLAEHVYCDPGDKNLMYTSDDMIAAYLAGAAQTQADYTKHISAICDRHCL
jgi:hypothetical protein